MTRTNVAVCHCGQVEVHAHWWWQARMEAQGFIYSPDLTTKVLCVFS